MQINLFTLINYTSYSHLKYLTNHTDFLNVYFMYITILIKNCHICYTLLKLYINDEYNYNLILYL